MDFVRLGPVYSTSYVPDMLIEGYNSLIWTERFQDFGEFELKSFDVVGMLQTLPEDTLVSHLETKEVMMVETHEIAMVGEGQDARPEITVRGRSASTILEHRWVEAPYQKKRKMRKRYSATAAAAVLLVNAVDNSSGKDITRGDDDPDTEFAKNDYSWNTRDAIPNVAVTEVVASEGKSRWWRLEQGILYPQLQGILVSQDLGIRCYRPVTPSPGTVITVKTNLAERGQVVRTYNSNITQLRFEIYAGVDRSSSVQFSLLQGHIDKPTYLMSKKDYKTALEVMSGEIEVKDVTRAGEGGLTGWKRRVMGYDAGTPEIPDEPQRPKDPKANATSAERKQYREDLQKWVEKHARWKNKRDRIVADFREEAVDASEKELKAHRRMNMFAGDISSLSPYVYKTHYDLGDTVMLYGDYGKSSKMVVSEYVRSEDADGDRGFPGLIEP